MKKNPTHSCLYKEYRKHVRYINQYLTDIRNLKTEISYRGSQYLPESEYVETLQRVRERLKHHQHIVRYLKEEIRYQNNLTPEKMIQYYNDHAFPKSIPVTLTPTKTKENETL